MKTAIQWRKGLGRIFLEMALLLAIIILASVSVLAWEFSRGPINLDAFRPLLEKKLTQLRDGREVGLSALLLEWSKDRNWIVFTAYNLTALDRSGAPVIEAERAEITFKALPLLRREIVPQDISLKSGSIRIPVLRGNSSFHWLGLLQEQLRVNTLQDVNLSEFRLEFGDDGEAPLLENFGGTVHFTQRGASLSMQGYAPVPAWDSGGLDGGLRKRQALTLLGGLDFRAGGAVLELEVSARDFSDLQEQLFPVHGVLYTGELELSARLFVHPAIGQAPLVLGLKGSGGHFVLRPEKSVEVQDFAGILFYDMDQKQLLIREFEFDGPVFGGQLSGVIALDSGVPELDIRVKGLRSGDSDWFEHSVVFDSLSLRGRLFPEEKLFRASAASIGVGSFLLSGSGEVYLERVEGQQQVGLKLTSSGEGDIDRAAILSYWPVFLAPEGRIWLRDQVIDGRLVRMTLQMDCPPGLLTAKPMPDSLLTARFMVEDAKLRTIPGLAPVSAIFGEAEIRGNSADFKVESANFGEWEIYQGDVDIDQLYPPDKPGRLQARGRGELPGLMRVLEGLPYNSASQHGLDIDRMDGGGDIEIELFFPLEEMEEELANLVVPYTVSGMFENVVVPDLLGEFGLKDAQFSLSGTEKGYILEGKGRFADIAVDFTWTDKIIDPPNVTSSHLTATGIADENTLHTFGFAARDLLRGPVGFSLDARGSGAVLDTISIAYNFTDTVLDVPYLLWKKEAGVEARAHSYYALDEFGRASMLMDAASAGLFFSADTLFNESGGLLRANIDSLDITDHFAGRGSISRTGDFSYKILYSGEKFDISYFLESLFSFDWTGMGETPAIDLEMDIKELALLGGESLGNASIDLDYSGTEFESVHVNGAIGTDKRISMALAKREEQSILKINSEDAGFLLRGILGKSSLEGGELDATALFSDEGTSVHVDIRDSNLKEVPLLARILSLASFRGLIDTFRQKGLHFSEIELPMEIRRGQVLIPGARASGPGLGLTARGWLTPGDGSLAIDGVVVPSFGINSALGRIPLIGDLFVSREGEGVLALVYSLRGDVQDAEVRINPFSVIAPGILRRIFENPTEIPPEEVLSEAEAEARAKAEAEAQAEAQQTSP